MISSNSEETKASMRLVRMYFWTSSCAFCACQTRRRRHQDKNAENIECLHFLQKHSP